MKTLKLSIVLVVLWNSIYVYAFGSDTTKTLSIARDSLAGDSTEYDIEVLDPAYETFLLTQPPKEYYTETYYKNWNQQYVSVWNSRYLSQARSGLYETYIDYEPMTAYGLDVEYKLYYFFRFFERKTGVTLIPRGR